MNRSASIPLSLLAGFILLAGCEAQPEVEAVQEREVEQYTIEEFLETTNYSGASFSPDNSKILVSSNQTGIYNAYALPVDGGTPIQLTNSTDDYVFTRGYFPNEERFLYTSDEGGNELNHVFVQAPEGEAIDLTPGDGHRAMFLGWTWDDSAFLVGTTERDERFFDVYRYDPETYDREMIFQNDEGLEFAEISPDGRYLALTKTVSNADVDIYLYDRETGEKIGRAHV